MFSGDLMEHHRPASGRPPSDVEGEWGQDVLVGVSCLTAEMVETLEQRAGDPGQDRGGAACQLGGLRQVSACLSLGFHVCKMGAVATGPQADPRRSV